MEEATAAESLTLLEAEEEGEEEEEEEKEMNERLSEVKDGRRGMKEDEEKEDREDMKHPSTREESVPGYYGLARAAVAPGSGGHRLWSCPGHQH